MKEGPSGWAIRWLIASYRHAPDAARVSNLGALRVAPSGGRQYQGVEPPLPLERAARRATGIRRGLRPSASRTFTEDPRTKNSKRSDCICSAEGEYEPRFGMVGRGAPRDALRELKSRVD